MIIKVYARLEPITLYDKGIEVGLSKKAAEYFRHFEEVELELAVDAENGAVCHCKVIEPEGGFNAP